MTLPNHFGVDDPNSLVQLAREMDQAGLGSLWVGDHLVHADYVARRLGSRAYHHPLTLLAYVGAVTANITLGTSVLVSSFRNPFDLAKSIATLDHLTGGRVILG